MHAALPARGKSTDVSSLLTHAHVLAEGSATSTRCPLYVSSHDASYKYLLHPTGERFLEESGLAPRQPKNKIKPAKKKHADSEAIVEPNPKKAKLDIKEAHEKPSRETINYASLGSDDVDESTFAFLEAVKKAPPRATSGPSSVIVFSEPGKPQPAAIGTFAHRKLFMVRAF